MVQYKFANHENNVLVRNWCNENRGRGVTLSEQLFPEMQHPGSGIAKYKCGEQFIDDEMLIRAKVIMAEIEELEKQGKRKVYKTKLAGPKLETNKKENYAEIENTQEFLDYVDFHNKYSGYSELFFEKLKLELPVYARASNLMCANFRHKLNKAKKLVIEMQLEPSLTKKKQKEAKAKNLRISKIREASKEIKIPQVPNMTPKEEFNAIISQIDSDPKLSKLVPVILMMNFSQEKDMDQLENIYNKFKNTTNNFSIVKLVNAKAAFNKAIEMISKGWLAEDKEKAA